MRADDSAGLRVDSKIKTHVVFAQMDHSVKSISVISQISHIKLCEIKVCQTHAISEHGLHGIGGSIEVGEVEACQIGATTEHGKHRACTCGGEVGDVKARQAAAIIKHSVHVIDP